MNVKKGIPHSVRCSTTTSIQQLIESGTTKRPLEMQSASGRFGGSITVQSIA